MQILYVGNGNYKHRGARYYDVGRKLCNGLTRAGHNVYFLSDRDEARSATLFGARKLGTRHCNNVFLDICANFKPEFILIGHADIIQNDSLVRARKLLPKVKIAQFNVDALFNPHTVQQIAVKAPFCDATFVTTGGDILKRFSHPGSLVAYMPNPVDPSMEWPRCHERSDQAYDVFWACRAMDGGYPGDPRIELPLHLKNSKKVAIDYHGMKGRPPLMNADYYTHIANARMGLNISNVRYRSSDRRALPDEIYLYSSDRISHYMGSGLLTFTTRDNQLEKLFTENEELVFFSGQDELLEKVLYFKEHDAERKRIARAGWERIQTHFNATRVAQYILEVTFRQVLSESYYAWPRSTY